MHRIKKGEYGYISYCKKLTVIRTAVYFALCAAVFIIGFITTGTRKNLLTVVAVLGCLPAAKSMVNMIMFLRARGCERMTHERIEETCARSDHMESAYDLYMTSYNMNFPISHIVACGSMVTGFMDETDADRLRACEKHIEEHLKTDGYKDITVKIFGDVSKYTGRLMRLKELDAVENARSVGILETLKSISL